MRCDIVRQWERDEPPLPLLRLFDRPLPGLGTFQIIIQEVLLPVSLTPFASHLSVDY
jgi:hypothetical protein